MTLEIRRSSLEKNTILSTNSIVDFIIPIRAVSAGGWKKLIGKISMYCATTLIVLVLVSSTYVINGQDEDNEDVDDGLMRQIRKPISIAMPRKDIRGIIPIARPKARAVIPIARPQTRRWSPPLLKYRQGRSMPRFLNPNRMKWYRTARSEFDTESSESNEESGPRMRRQINRHPVRFG